MVATIVSACGETKQQPSGEANIVMDSEIFKQVQTEYDSIGSFYNGYAITKENGSYGIIDYKGKKILDNKYQTLELDSLTECYIAEYENSFGIITANGENKIPFIYSSLVRVTIDYNKPFDYIIASTKGKYGIIDDNNNVIVPFQFDEIKSCTAKGFAAIKNDYYGVCDWSGNVKLDFKYDYVCIFDDMSGNYRKNNKIGLIDSNFNLVTDCKFDDLKTVFVDGEWATDYEELMSLGKWGIYNSKTGAEIIHPIYDQLSMDCNEGLIWAQKGDKVGFIDLSGNTVIPFVYEDASSFSEGLAYVVKSHKGGFIDKSNKIIIPFQYTAWNDSEFSEGLAKMGVSLSGHSNPDIYGFIDKTGKFIIKPQFENIVSDFKYGYSVVMYQGKYGAINKLGEFIIPNLYDNYSFDDKCKIIIFMQDGKECRFDCNGNPI